MAQVDATAVGRERDKHALARFDAYYADIEKAAQETGDTRRADWVRRKADHFLTMRAYGAQAMAEGKAAAAAALKAGATQAQADCIMARARRRGIEAFKAYWYGSGPDAAALDAKAREVYGVPYSALCCDRKRAVVAAIATASPVSTPPERTSRP
jgi:hypothetical protein